MPTTHRTRRRSARCSRCLACTVRKQRLSHLAFALCRLLDAGAAIGWRPSQDFEVHQVTCAAWTRPGSAQPIVVRLSTHPVRGHALLDEAGSAGAAVLDVCLHHHERMDSSGYLVGLVSETISLFAKIAAVCSLDGAITSDRLYKAGWDPGEAMRRQNLSRVWIRPRSSVDCGLSRSSTRRLRLGRAPWIGHRRHSSADSPIPCLEFRTPSQASANGCTGF